MKQTKQTNKQPLDLYQESCHTQNSFLFDWALSLRRCGRSRLVRHDGVCFALMVQYELLELLLAVSGWLVRG